MGLHIRIEILQSTSDTAALIDLAFGFASLAEFELALSGQIDVARFQSALVHKAINSTS